MSQSPKFNESSQCTHVKLRGALEAIHKEIDVFACDLGLLRNQRDEYESKLSSQINELNFIRQSLYELESQHSKIRKQYEDELSHLRAELHAIRRGTANPPLQTLPAGPVPDTASGHPASPASLPGAFRTTDGSCHDPCCSRDREIWDRGWTRERREHDREHLLKETRGSSKQSA